MKLRLLALAAVAFGAPASARTFLASITGIRLGPNEHVDKFAIDTWGADIVATCRIPPGWTITAGRGIDPGGVISGEAGGGVAFLDRARLGELRDLVLIRLDGPVRRREARDGGSTLPATFAGQAEIGHYGDDAEPRKQPLTYADVRLTPATRCPSPRAR